MDPNAKFYRLVNGIEVPSFETRDVKGFTLENGLKTVVISDPTSEVAAASVQVSVGYFSDPDNLPGLAHFLEHMLFMGTEKYPDENSFSAFLNEHGGYSNAYTASEETNYHFEVQANALRETLDRFSGFFTCPLLTASGASRELDAVDSENSKNLQSDAWRDNQLDKCTSDPTHPYSKFGTGNKETLGDGPSRLGIDVRAALLKFHKEHYSAGRSTLCVVGSESVGELESWVREFFSSYSNNSSKSPVFNALNPSPLRLWIVPIKDTRTLTVSWVLPALRSQWRSKPLSYLSHLIGHEGPGSILSALMARGWATGLYAGESEETTCFSKFDVQVTLSPEGLAHSEGVLGVLFAYLGMLDAQGPQKWAWEEDGGVKGTQFKFMNKQQPMGAATEISSALSLYPLRYIFSGGKLVWEWDADAVSSCLGLMTASAVKITIVSKEMAKRAKLTEKWYGTNYDTAPLTGELISSLEATRSSYRSITLSRMNKLASSDVGGAGACVVGGMQARALGCEYPGEVGDIPPLTLPSPNPFISTDFSLLNPLAASRRAGEISFSGTEQQLTPLSPFSKSLEAGLVRIRREPEPVPLASPPGRSLWWHSDGFFCQPKVYCYSLFTFPAGSSSPRGCALLDMYQTLVTESLRELGYAAQLAGLRYGLNLTGTCSLLVWVSGFSEKAPYLLSRIAATLAAPEFTEAQFFMHREARCRFYSNTAMDQPINQATRFASQSLLRPTWNRLLELLPEASALTPKDLTDFIPGLVSSMGILLLVSGNADKEYALACGEALWGTLDRKGGKAPLPSLSGGPRVTALPLPMTCGNSTLCFDLFRIQPAPNPADPNGAIEYLVQFGPHAGFRRAAAILFVAHVVRESFFVSVVVVCVCV